MVSSVYLFIAILWAGSVTAAQPDTVDSFLKQHWNRPLAAQGDAPEHFSPLEKSLAPKACAACHAQQYDDWQTTQHSRAMGPGVLGQMLDMAPQALDEHQSCLRCHAPLQEQAQALVSEIKTATGGMHHQGLTCAGCHLRERTVFGPMPRTGRSDTAGSGPHGDFTISSAYEDSRFCAACHQFDADGYALNGKLLENTYQEWSASRYAREGRSCQSCHMPDRRHLWRGIHDPEMTRQGVTISSTPPRKEGKEIDARLVLRNSNTGHHFPTYVTPRVVMAMWQEDAQGKVIEVTRRELIIARQVSPDLSREVADTRLAPDSEAVLAYRVPRHPDATQLVSNIRVEPDFFYIGLYQSLLALSPPERRGSALIRQALATSKASAFDLHLIQYPL
ncbi:MAG: multiheme c-type cytochrome [Pseudomonadota bacterium]